ncbi:MAG: ECF-type sigma factor [Planctomycetaceae bacterium]
MPTNSVTLWIQALRAGDDTAAQELWRLYFGQLMQIARSRMASLPCAVYDEEDAAISTFRVLCEKLREGRYPELADRDELWKLMLKMLVRKVGRRSEYEATQKRSASRAPIDSADLSFSDDQSLTVFVAEECELLFCRLNDPNLEQLVLWKLEGYTNDEIAQKMNRTRRTIQRMLSLVRDIWLKAGDDADT